MTLQAAIEKAIREIAPRHSSVSSAELNRIVALVNQEKFFPRVDNYKISASRIITRVKSSPELFIYDPTNNRVSLADPNNVVNTSVSYIERFEKVLDKLFLYGSFNHIVSLELILGVIAIYMLEDSNSKELNRIIKSNKKEVFLTVLDKIKHQFDDESFQANAWKTLQQTLNFKGVELKSFAPLTEINFEETKLSTGIFIHKALEKAVEDLITKMAFREGGIFQTTTLEKETIKYLLQIKETPKARNFYAPFSGIGGLVFDLIRDLEQRSQPRFKRIFDLKKHGYNFKIREFNQNAANYSYFLSIIHQYSGIDLNCEDSTMTVPFEKDEVDLMIADIPFLKLKNESIEISTIEQARKVLKNSGKAAFIIRGHFFHSQSQRDVKLRKKLIEEDLIEFIVSFNFKGIKRAHGAVKNLLILNKNKINKNKVTFWKVRSKNQLEKLEGGVNFKIENKCSVDSVELLQNDGSLTPQRYLTDIGKEIKGKEFVSLKDCFLQKRFESIKSTDYHPFITVRILAFLKDKNSLLERVEKFEPAKNPRRGKLVNEDSILLSKIGGQLNPTFFKFDETPIIISNDIFVYKLNTEKIFPSYFISELQQEYVQNQVYAFSGSTIRPRISTKDLEKIQINVPSLEDQKQILKSREAYQKFLEYNQVNEPEITYGNKSILLPALKHTIGQYLSDLNTNLATLKNLLDKKDASGESFNWNERISPNPNNPKTIENTYSKIEGAAGDIGRSFETVKKIVDFEEEGTEKVEENIKDFIKKSKADFLLNHPQIDFQIFHSEELRNKDLIVKFDKRQLKIFINNFIENSVKHGFNDFVFAKRITVTLTPNIPEGLLYLDFSNNGHPLSIPFEGFVSLFRTTDKKVGTGLGGFLMMKIAENHGGKLEQISEPDEQDGFTLRLSLPYQIN